MKSHYEPEEWAAQATRRLFNYNFRLFGKEFKGWDLLKVVDMEKGQEVVDKVYLWQGKEEHAGEMLRIETAEFYHWRQAQKWLYEHLRHSMRPAIPHGSGKLTQLGDVNFVGRDPHTAVAAAISFSRGNICVIVSSVGERNVDVSEVASTVDNALNGSSDKLKTKKMQVQVLVHKAVLSKEKESQVLIDNFEKEAPRDGWLQVIAPEGELSRRGDALVFVPSKPGKKSIAIYAAKALSKAFLTKIAKRILDV